MVINKCDLCGTLYGEETVDNYSYVTIWDKDHAGKCHDCCPQCTKSIEGLLRLLKQGDDFEIRVIQKED